MYAFIEAMSCSSFEGLETVIFTLCWGERIWSDCREILKVKNRIRECKISMRGGGGTRANLSRLHLGPDFRHG